MTYPSYLDGVAGSQYATTTPTLSKPSGVAAGQAMVAALLSNDPYRNVLTVPDGWQLLKNISSTASPGGRLWVYTKTAGASEPASYTWTLDYGFNGMTAIFAVQTTEWLSVYDGAVAADSTSPYAATAPSITLPDASSLVVWIGGCVTYEVPTEATASVPGGMTSRLVGTDWGNYASLAVADLQQASAGATGSKSGSFTLADGGDALGFGVLLGFSPTGGASTIPASGDMEMPVISSVAITPTSAALTTGNYTDLTCVVSDQTQTGIPYLTGTPSSSSTSVATVSQLAPTGANGDATLRVVGVAPGSSQISFTIDGVTSNVVTVNVTSVGGVVAVYPAGQTVPAYGTQQFSASVSGDSSATFTWSIVSGGGSISSGGLFTAPGTAGTTVVRATYDADNNLYSDVTVTVVAEVNSGMFDSTTFAAYLAALTPQARAEAVRDQLGSGTLYVELRDSDTLYYTGTFTGPLTANVDGSISWSGALSGYVITSGPPNAATWTCKIRNADGSRYIVGSFGPGGRFNSSSAVLVAGIELRLNLSIQPPD